MNIFKHIAAALLLLVSASGVIAAQGSGKDNTFGGVVRLDKTCTISGTSWCRTAL